MKRTIESAVLLLAIVFLGGPAPLAQQPLLVPAGAKVQVGSAPADIATADFDGDGKLDVAAANSGSGNVSVLLGDGHGGLREAAGSPFAAGPKPHLAVAGDFNGDGKADLAVTEHDSNDVRVFLNDGAGRFRTAPGSPFAALARTPPHNHGLSTADFNGDGNLDLATSNQNDHSVSVLLGNGRGSFAPARSSPFAVGRAPYPHAWGDFNRDGKLDIVAPNVGGHTISILLNDGKAGFANAPGSPISVLERPYYVAVGDLNADGRADIVVTHDDTSHITVLLGVGDGRFRPAPGSPVNAGRRGSKTLIGDLNGDGKPDVALAAGSAIIVLLGDGAGRLAPAPGSPYAAGAGTWSVALADLDGDGAPEILAASSERNELSILRRARQP